MATLRSTFLFLLEFKKRFQDELCYCQLKALKRRIQRSDAGEFFGERIKCRCVTVRVDGNAILPPQIPQLAKTTMAQSLHFDCDRNSSGGVYAKLGSSFLKNEKRYMRSESQMLFFFFFFCLNMQTRHFVWSFLELWGQTQMVIMVPHSYPRP